MPIMKPRSSRMASGSGGVNMSASSMMAGVAGADARASKYDTGITMVSHSSGISVGGSGGAASSSSGAGVGPNGLAQAGGQRGSAANQTQANQQQLASAAQARKRRSSINVYDQPSSLNSRLRQLETDMLRLDEDRTKLFDDTHSALTQYEIKLGEIHAILKSRQDNVEKYVEEMKMLLQAKEEFEKQTKLLNEKHDRIQEKFMHRETIISREIKLLKNKFELLEKNRQFRSLLAQKSSANASAESTQRDDSDLISGLETGDLIGRKRSETGTMMTITTANSDDGDRLSANGGLKLGESAELGGGSRRQGGGGGAGAGGGSGGGGGGGIKNVRIKMSKLGAIGQIFTPLIRLTRGKKSALRHQKRRKNNKVSSIMANPTMLASNSVSTTVAANNAAANREGARSLTPIVDAAGGASDCSPAAATPTRKGTASGSLMSRLFS